MLKRSLCLLVFVFIAIAAHAQYGHGFGLRSGPFMRSSPNSLLYKPPNLWAQYNKAKDAGKNLNGFWRTEMSGGFIFATATYIQHYQEIDVNDRVVFDSVITRTIKPKSAFIFSDMSGYPLATFGESSALLVTYGVNVRLLNWTQPGTDIRGIPRTYHITNEEFSVVSTLDYKSGGEAMLDRSKRFCFTAGVGTEFRWESWSYQHLRIHPVAKMEVGYVTGIAAFKLQASAVLGKFNYNQYGSWEENYDTYSHANSTISIKGANQFILSLLIMPMAAQWEDAAWYR